MNAGIDYGMGQTNVDKETGIRYGVISQHSVLQAWADSAEPDYGDATCPKCGSVAIAFDTTKHDEYEQYDQEHFNSGCADYACEHCKITIDTGDVFSNDAIGYSYSGDGYEMSDCLDSDIIITASPYYTYAPYCSPCVPGAGNLNSAEDCDQNNGVKTFCVGHDWFEDGAPYEVYSVATNQLVEHEDA